MHNPTNRRKHNSSIRPGRFLSAFSRYFVDKRRYGFPYFCPSLILSEHACII
eukprot:UN13949